MAWWASLWFGTVCTCATSSSQLFLSICNPLEASQSLPFGLLQTKSDIVMIWAGGVVQWCCRTQRGNYHTTLWPLTAFLLVSGTHRRSTTLQTGFFQWQQVCRGFLLPCCGSLLAAQCFLRQLRAVLQTSKCLHICPFWPHDGIWFTQTPNTPCQLAPLREHE